ncbi:MAG: DOMON-like domain-containing protein [Thiohalomonadales bacterium]
MAVAEAVRQLHFGLVPFKFPNPPLSELVPPQIDIAGTIQIKQSTLKIQYRISGSGVLDVHWPEDSKDPQPKDDLWRTTCFELFIATKYDSDYLEFNFSPSRDWAVYAFKKYRERKELVAVPDVHVRNGCIEAKILTEVTFILDKEYQGKLLDIGTSAIIENVQGDVFYYALSHQGDSPDFHQRDTFLIDI